MPLCLQRELGQLVLKRFLLLVLLLDKAATHLTAAFRTPLLFKLTASIKSSRQVRPAGVWCSLSSSHRLCWLPLWACRIGFCLLKHRGTCTHHYHPPAPGLRLVGCLSRVQVVSDFLQSRLVGEGNVLRHLELLGYRLGYSQSTLMEYPFAITNLAVDLRDGLRLIKVAEVLTGTRGAQCAGQGAAPALLSQTTGTDTVPLCKKCASHNAVRARDCAVFTLSCR